MATQQQLRINPQPPINEDHDMPAFNRCWTDQEVQILSSTTGETYSKKVTLVAASQNPAQAYIEIPTKDRKNLDHHGQGWGYVFFALAIPSVSDDDHPGIFQEPQPGRVEYVAIKKLNIAVVDAALQAGKKENPYKEIRRMQTIGDNHHVLKCIEALQDSNGEYMYIVMPYCEEESLVEWIPWKQPQGGLDEYRARVIFIQILENIEYLRSHNICHRDLSPDNCMIYKGRVVLTDLAMSFKINPELGEFVKPLGGFGKPAYLPPEVFFNLAFNAWGCDLWSSAVILFNLLTGEILYEQPEPGNILFRYFILAKGLSNTPVNERTVEILSEISSAEERSSLQSIAEKCLRLSPEVLTLLEGMLRVAFQKRWTAKEIHQSTWIQQQRLQQNSQR